MKHNHLKLVSLILLACLSLSLRAQEGLKIEQLFTKYGNAKGVTLVELNGEILASYHMDTYLSLVFEDVTPYAPEIEACLEDAVQSLQVRKRQLVNQSGTLQSVYLQLTNVRRKGKKLQRYVLFKRGKNTTATLIYIEGSLSEKELMDMLYKKP